MPSNEHRRPKDASVRLLMVCTGNLCRSPYAQALLGDHLERVRPGVFDVSQRGDRAPGGYAGGPRAPRPSCATGGSAPTASGRVG